MTYLLFLDSLFYISIDLDGNLDRLNHQTIDLQFIVYRQIFKRKKT